MTHKKQLGRFLNLMFYIFLIIVDDYELLFQSFAYFVHAKYCNNFNYHRKRAKVFENREWNVKFETKGTTTVLVSVPSPWWTS